jgi:hypothetical protein
MSVVSLASAQVVQLSPADLTDRDFVLGITMSEVSSGAPLRSFPIYHVAVDDGKCSFYRFGDGLSQTSADISAETLAALVGVLVPALSEADLSVGRFPDPAVGMQCSIHLHTPGLQLVRYFEPSDANVIPEVVAKALAIFEAPEYAPIEADHSD